MGIKEVVTAWKCPKNLSGHPSGLRFGSEACGGWQGAGPKTQGPWNPCRPDWFDRQNPYVERLIGSIRRDCLDHIIVLGERHLRRLLSRYRNYYHDSRTHLGLGKDTPNGRPEQIRSDAPIIAIPEVGGLHHRYERAA
jgi:hypothetical protein